VSFLDGMGLARRGLGFWGLYLDSLLVSGRLVVCLQEIKTVLKQNPHLPWAKTAYDRLPILWRKLGQRVFVWTEDDGVQVLVRALSERRPQTLLSTVISSGD